jgi:hypothetical protein
MAEVAIKPDLLASVFRVISAFRQNTIQRLREAFGVTRSNQTNKRSAFR